jgi:alkylated DNA repair dioxygenase AlkB
MNAINSDVSAAADAASFDPLRSDLEKETLFLPGFIPTPEELFAAVRRDARWDTSMDVREMANFGVPWTSTHLVFPRIEMPDYLMEICRRISLELGERGFMPNNCLLNFYKDGKSRMGFHSDNVNEMIEGTGVVILSLGAVRELTFRRFDDKARRFRFSLESGSLFFMTRELQRNWQHGVMSASRKIGARMSLTFRQVPENSARIEGSSNHGGY